MDYSYKILEYILTQKEYFTKNQVIKAATSLKLLVTDDNRLQDEIKVSYDEAIEKLESLSFEEMKEIIELLLKGNDEINEKPNVSLADKESAQEMYEAGVMSYKKRDYKRAFSLFIKAANLEHVGAMYNVGVCLYYGRGIEKNRKSALEYWGKAAQHGLKEAESALSKANE